MPTPAALLAEIQSGPLAAALAPLVAAGNDRAVADALNAKTLAGYVPIAEVSAPCLKFGLTGKLEFWMYVYAFKTAHGTAQAGETAMGVACSQALTLLRDDYRLTGADVADEDFVAAMNAFKAAGWLTDTQVGYLTSLGGGRASRAEVAFGWGTQISPADVSKATRGTT